MRCLEESGSEAIEWDWQGLKREANCFLRIGFLLRKMRVLVMDDGDGYLRRVPLLPPNHLKAVRMAVSM